MSTSDVGRGSGSRVVDFVFWMFSGAGSWGKTPLRVQEDHSLFLEGGPIKGPKCWQRAKIAPGSEYVFHKLKYCWNLLMSYDHQWGLLEPRVYKLDF